MEASIVVICVALGIFATVVARGQQRLSRGFRSTWSILLSDFTFDRYATLSLISLFYAVITGALIGLFVSLLAIYFISDGRELNYLLYSVGSLLLIPIVRLSVEQIVLLFKTGDSISSYLDDLQSRNSQSKRSYAALSKKHESEPFKVSESVGVSPINYQYIEFDSRISDDELLRIIVDNIGNSVDMRNLMINQSCIDRGNTLIEVVSATGDLVATYTKLVDGRWKRKLYVK